MGVRPVYLFSGGRVTVPELCNAFLSRTRHMCGKPSVLGKTKCRGHGGFSTGPRTEEGLQRLAAAKTVHGPRDEGAEGSQKPNKPRVAPIGRGSLRGGLDPWSKDQGSETKPVAPV